MHKWGLNSQSQLLLFCSHAKFHHSESLYLCFSCNCISLSPPTQQWPLQRHTLSSFFLFTSSLALPVAFKPRPSTCRGNCSMAPRSASSPNQVCLAALTFSFYCYGSKTACSLCLSVILIS